jgi:hypothetical protein
MIITLLEEIKHLDEGLILNKEFVDASFQRDDCNGTFMDLEHFPTLWPSEPSQKLDAISSILGGPELGVIGSRRRMRPALQNYVFFL